jgi:uncharacterized protein YdcH (DUF465 family)
MAGNHHSLSIVACVLDEGSVYNASLRHSGPKGKQPISGQIGMWVAPRLSTKRQIHHLRGAPQYGNCYDYVNTMFQLGGKRMPITTRDARQTLLETDVEFRSLAEEHSRCETQLKQLLTEPYLSSEDLALETTLKKIKLRLKDQMEMIVARSRQHSALPT